MCVYFNMNKVVQNIVEKFYNANLLADISDDDIDSLSVQSKQMNNKRQYNDSIKEQFINAVIQNADKLNDRVKQQINKYPKGYLNIFQPANIDELKLLIMVGKRLLGNDGNFNWIDTSKITSMTQLFYGDSYFNGDISLWDVSNVRYMGSMFMWAEKFNQPIGNWDVSHVTDMSYMFNFAK